MRDSTLITTKWQMSRFAFILMNAEVTIFLVPYLIASSSYQAWIAVVVGGVLSLGILACTCYVGHLQKRRAWVDFGRDIIGKWPHRAVLALLICWCVLSVSDDIENFVLFFGSNYLRGTPPVFIQLVAALVIWSTVRHSFATLVYMADGLVLVIGAALFLAGLLFVRDANYQMLPALIHYHDWTLVAKDSSVVVSWLATWVLYLFIMPELQLDRKIFKNFAVAQLLVMIVLTGGWLLTLLNFGPQLASKLKYPYMDIIRSATHNSILGNIDPLLIGVWSSSLFLHSAFLLYVAYRCTTALLKGKGGEQPVKALLVAASTLIAFAFSQNVPFYERFYHSYGLVLVWLFVEGIPVYYSVVALIKYRKKKASPLL
jgi:spore germination protein KB